MATSGWSIEQNNFQRKKNATDTSNFNLDDRNRIKKEKRLEVLHDMLEKKKERMKKEEEQRDKEREKGKK